MWPNPFSKWDRLQPVNPKLLALALLCCAAASAQDLSTVAISSPQDVILCGRTVSLLASGMDSFGASVDFSPRWRSLNESIATVDSSGTVKALRPGIVQIEAADPASGISGDYSLTLQPLRIDITPAHPILRVGGSVKLSASAVDADGKPIDSVQFMWVSGIGGIAKLAADGTLTALKAGSLTVSAAIQSSSGPLDFTSSALVNVYRKPDYLLTELLRSTDAAPAATLVAPSMISAAGDSLLGFIGDLSTGAQALFISESGVPRVLATTGQLLPSAGKIINRITGVSINHAGDVAATVMFPAEYCDTALVLFRRGQPESIMEEGCNLIIVDRALDDKGNVVYYSNDSGNRFYLHAADGSRKLIVQSGDQIEANVTVGSLGRATLTSSGAAILEVYPSGGAEKIYRWDGTKFQALVSIGDFFASRQVNGIDSLVESASGELYGRFNFSDGNPRVMHYTGGTWSVMAQANTIMGDTRLYYIYRLAPSGGSVAFVADSDKGSGVLRLNSPNLDRLSNLPTGNDVTQLVSGSSTVFALGGFGSKSLSVYQLGGSSSTTAPLLSLPFPLPSAGLASVQWDILPERGSATAPVMRLPGDSFGRVSAGAIQFLAGPSSAVNNLPTSAVGNAVTKPDGTAIFTMYTSNGPVLMSAHDGKLDLLADTVSKKLSVGFNTITWFDYGGPSPYAINAAGQFVAMANTGNTTHLWRFDLAAGDFKDVAQFQTASPAGPAYGYVPRAAIDPAGRVAFISDLQDGTQGLFLWENGNVRKLLRTTETALPPGQLISQLINGIHNVQFAGSTLVARIGYQSTTIIQSFDGQNWQPVVSQGDLLSTGRTVDNFVGPETIANAAGDIAYLARGGSYASLLVRTHDGRDVLVATTAEPLPDGSWPIFFYGFSLTTTGDLLVVAETWQNGQSTMTLYRASPAN